MACLVLLTPLASVSAFLCTSGASIYASQGQVVEAVSEHLHRIGRVLLQISLRSGRSGLLVRGSLPSFSPLAVTHCQIPLPGVRTSNFLAASSFSLLHHHRIRSGSSGETLTKKSDYKEVIRRKQRNLRNEIHPEQIWLM